MAGSSEGPWSIPGKPQHPMGEPAGSASQLRTSSPGVSRGCIPATFLLGRNFKTRRRYHSGRFGRHSRMANLRLPLQTRPDDSLECHKMYGLGSWPSRSRGRVGERPGPRMEAGGDPTPPQVSHKALEDRTLVLSTGRPRHGTPEAVTSAL